MLKFDHLNEAVQKATFLKEFCYGVRIIGDGDENVLYSSLPQSNGSLPLRRADGSAGCMRIIGDGESERGIYIGRNQEPYEITSVPVEVGDTRCRLEMIQPYRRVISTVTGESVYAFDGEEYLAATIGGLILKDTLTGLYNRRYIDENLPAAISAACDRGRPLSVIFADIDQFKSVNDRFGHITGDLVLQHVAQLLQKKIRKTDSWVARYGGDEFVICLPGVDNAAAHRSANRLRVAIMNEGFPLENGLLSLTCSFGVQTVDHSDFQLSALMLLHSADENLYRAKHAGRNAVV